MQTVESFQTCGAAQVSAALAAPSLEAAHPRVPLVPPLNHYRPPGHLDARPPWDSALAVTHYQVQPADTETPIIS